MSRADQCQLGPIQDEERADVLDALRGFALLGIFVSHIPDFSGYSFMTSAQHNALDHFGVDTAVAAIQDFLIRGKFYSLFSLLFGIGFAVQIESAGRRGADFTRHFARRLVVLMIIGIAHAGLWYGDILKDYALIGFLLIPLRNLKVATVAWIAGLGFLMRVAWPIIIATLLHVTSSASSSAHPGADFGALTRTFGGSDAGSMFIANLGLVRLKALQMIYDGRALSILSMFVLGALVGRLRLYRNVSEHRNLFRKAFWVCAPIGVIGNVVLTPLHAATPDFPPTVVWVAEDTLYAIAVPSLAIAYACGFAWLWSSERAPMLRWLAPAGRMAVTTYVAQTLLGVGLFYGVGLGFGGRLGLVEGTALAFGIFALQCLAAAVWLRWFRFGPIEWVWRRLTYGAPIKFTRAGSSPTSRAYV